MTQVLTINNQEYIPAGQVGKHFGYTRDYILMLARDGKIDGKKVGHRWYVNLKSAEVFFISAKVQRDERKETIRQVRRAELRTYEKTAKRIPSRHSNALIETVAIVFIGLVIGMAGYVGGGEKGQAAALSLSDTSSSIKQFAISLYNLISPAQFEIHTLSVALEREERGSTNNTASPETVTRAEDQRKGAEAEVVHTSLVIGPDELLTTTKIQSIKESFSDEVSISIDPHDPDTGIIIPHFKDGDGEAYRYLMVPVMEERTQ